MSDKNTIFSADKNSILISNRFDEDQKGPWVHNVKSSSPEQIAAFLNQALRMGYREAQEDMRVAMGFKS